MFEKGGGILDRGGYKIVPEMRLKEPREMVNGRPVREPIDARGGRELERTAGMNHWANLVECVRTRQRPIGDIETVRRSTYREEGGA